MGNRKDNIEEKAVNESETAVAVADEEITQEAPALHGVDKKDGTVVVCLKHPQGIKFNLPNGKSVIINGNATHLKGLRSGVIPDGGFGMTTIGREDWEYIKKAYGTMDIFKNGLIFSSNDKDSAESQAKEHDEIKSGMEPIEVGDNTSVNALKKVQKFKKDE